MAYRAVAGLLWILAAYDSLMCRGLFWDGAAFLVNIIDGGTFHDFYPARAHVGWATQFPVLAALKIGVVDTRVLAIIQSAALFGLPVGLYHLALARVRHDAVLLAIVMAAIALVYFPTSFFIVGEYNTLFAAATATMAIAATSERRRVLDGLLLCALAVLSVRSYEAMVYFGPLLAAVALWWRHGMPADERGPRWLGVVAALGFAGGTVVSGATIIEYWDHPHFTLVRGAILDFWQNLQFVVPLAGFGIFVGLSLIWPPWLRGLAPMLLIAITAVVLISTLWFRHWFDPEAMVFPPAHYVARTAAGCLLWALLVAMWLQAVWRRGVPRVLAVLREATVSRRLVSAMVGLILASAIPDLVLTRLWSGYLVYFHGLTAGRTANVLSRDLPNRAWPYRLFSQEWTAPALSSLLRTQPTEGIVLGPQRAADDMPFDSRCGTLPRLAGYRWRG